MPQSFNLCGRPVIKHRWLAAISLILLLLALGFAIDRILFLKTATETQGTVISVDSSNGRCGGGKRRRSRPCTRFVSIVQFADLEARPQQLSISSGSRRGHDQPSTYSRLPIGKSVSILYDPNDPSKAFENTTWGVWGIPLMLLFGQLITFVISLMEPRPKSKFPI